VKSENPYPQLSIEECPVVVQIDVRWSDMDAFGHVNNAVYYRYFETARFELYTRLGIMDAVKSGETGPIMAESSCRYLKPLSFPDRLLVGAAVTSAGASSFVVCYTLKSDVAGYAAAGRSALVFYDYRRAKPARLPDSFRESLRSFMAAPGPRSP
jgi:acyl-CoA thioester hydrolase